MKEIKMMSGRSFIIDDEELEKIKLLVAKEYRGLIGLKSGEMINTNSIDSIGEPELEPYFMGNKMSKDKTKVFVQGEWKSFAGDSKLIEYKPRTNQNDHTKLLR